MRLSVVKALADPEVRSRGRFIVYGLHELLSYAADLAEIRMSEPVLSVRGLSVDYPASGGRLRALREVLPAALVGKRQFYREQTPGEFVDLCWSTFADALLPLHEVGKLGAILFQFPRWVPKIPG